MPHGDPGFFRWWKSHSQQWSAISPNRVTVGAAANLKNMKCTHCKSSQLIFLDSEHHGLGDCGFDWYTMCYKCAVCWNHFQADTRDGTQHDEEDAGKIILSYISSEFPVIEEILMGHGPAGERVHCYGVAVELKNGDRTDQACEKLADCWVSHAKQAFADVDKTLTFYWREKPAFMFYGDKICLWTRFAIAGNPALWHNGINVAEGDCAPILGKEL